MIRRRRTRVGLLRRLIESACVSAQWEADPALSAADRLAWALSLHRLELQVPGLALCATIDEDVRLALQIRISTPCTEAMEAGLREVLDRSPSLLAELLRIDWADVWRACESAGRALPEAGAGRGA